MSARPPQRYGGDDAVGLAAQPAELPDGVFRITRLVQELVLEGNHLVAAKNERVGVSRSQAFCLGARERHRDVFGQYFRSARLDRALIGTMGNRSVNNAEAVEKSESVRRGGRDNERRLGRHGSTVLARQWRADAVNEGSLFFSTRPSLGAASLAMLSDGDF
jgi:hypothetical protein